MGDRGAGRPVLLHQGINYRLTLDDGDVVYSAGLLSFRMPMVEGDWRPMVFVPRPELWDRCAPAWLRDRDGDVVKALQEHTVFDVVYGPDRLYRVAFLHAEETTSNTRNSCPVCDPEVVTPMRPDLRQPDELILDLTATQGAVEERLADGRFEVIRADFPVTRMLHELEKDEKYTIVSYLRCTVSDEVVFWGLSLRGGPIYRHHTAWSPFTWPWTAPHPLVDNTADRPDVHPGGTPGVLADRATIRRAHEAFWDRSVGLPPMPGNRRHLPDRDIHLGLGYSIAEADTGVAYLVPFRGRVVFPNRWTDRKPEVLLPRPELWDTWAPKFLRGKRDVVAKRLREHSGHDVVVGPDDLFTVEL